MDVDTQEIASRLAGEHGVDGAIDLVTEAIAQCHDERDFYRLSIWREVRRDLRSRGGREPRDPETNPPS